MRFTDHKTLLQTVYPFCRSVRSVRIDTWLIRTVTVRVYWTTLTRRAQLVCDSPDSLQDETDYLNNVFSKNNYNTDFFRRNTHSNIAVTLTPTVRPTLGLLRQRLYRTSEAPLKLLHVYYNLTIYVLHTNR